MMERPPDREKKHSKSLIRTGCFGHSAAYGAFYAVRDYEDAFYGRDEAAFSSTADGLFNSILRVFGVPAQKWLQDTTLAMPSIAIMSIWQCVGMQMIIMLGGLQFIPEELYEAGTIDGANTWQQFVYITIPQLKNTLVYVFISNTIYSLKMFTQVYMLTQGGPAGSTTTLVYLMYQEGFTNNRVGYTSAMAVVFFLIVLVISLIQNKLTEGD